jgi:hypothetical protein
VLKLYYRAYGEFSAARGRNLTGGHLICMHKKFKIVLDIFILVQTSFDRSLLDLLEKNLRPIPHRIYSASSSASNASPTSASSRNKFGRKYLGLLQCVLCTISPSVPFVRMTYLVINHPKTYRGPWCNFKKKFL